MKLFSKNHSTVVSQSIDTKIKRSSGISYREMSLTLGDSQVVILRIKSSGDIFQVSLNKKLIPIKNQDDQSAAVIEIINAVNAGRTKFQKKLAALAAKLPTAIKTAAPKMLVTLTARRDELISAIADVETEIEALKKNSNSVETSNNLTQSGENDTLSSTAQSEAETSEDKKMNKLSEMSLADLHAKAKNWDNVQNEGHSDGYNPYREQIERLSEAYGDKASTSTKTEKAGAGIVFPQPESVAKPSYIVPSNGPVNLAGKTLTDGEPTSRDGVSGVLFRVYYNKAMNTVFVKTDGKPELSAAVDAYNKNLKAAIDKNSSAIKEIRSNPDKMALFTSAYLRSEESFSRGAGRDTMRILMDGGSIADAKAKLDRHGSSSPEMYGH
jgi:CRISPR/Cas system CMR-associated protein Cmr5 small subunit